MSNPNPSRISAPIWWLWGRFDALEPSAQLGGVYASKPGYHNYRAALIGWDYSVNEVAEDRQGPAAYASAIDLTMNDAAMRKYTTRLDVAAKARDERLYIGGVPILREFIGTKDSRSVYCYVLKGGRARGLPADAAEDWSRDSTHLWHLHLSVLRKFVNSQDAMERLLSVLSGESLSTWKSRTQTKAPAAEPEEEDEMMFQATQLPRGFAYDGDQALIMPESVLSLALPPIGLGKWERKRLYVGLSGDHADPANPPLVRVAINNGAWSTQVVKVLTGKRISVDVPATTDPQAYNLTFGRIDTGTPDHATLPISVLVEVV